MVFERFRAIGRGKERKDLEPAEKDILGRDVYAFGVVREILFPGIDWKNLNKKQKLDYYKRIRTYLEEFPTNLDAGNLKAVDIQNALQDKGLLFTHALEGCEYVITKFGGAGKGRLKEIKKEKLLKKAKTIPTPTSTPTPTIPGPRPSPTPTSTPTPTIPGPRPSPTPTSTPTPTIPGPRPSPTPTSTPTPIIPPGSKPSIEGFVLHGHFEGSDQIAYLAKHTGFGKHRMGVLGAVVRIWGPYADTTATTDDRGYYCFYGLPEGEYHMRAEKGGFEGVRGGYLADYKDKVTIPRPTKRRAFYQGQWVILEEPHTVRQDFELTPLESVSHKVSFTGGTGQTRDDVRRILHEYKDLGYDKTGLKQRLLGLRRSGKLSKDGAREIYDMLKDDTSDLNEIKRKMIESEFKHLGGRDKSFNVRNVRYVPSAIGKVNIFSTITDNFKSKIVTSAALLIAGMIVSALIGSPLFMFAFLCFVISTVLPTPKDYKHIQDRIAKISEHYENLKKSEAYHKASDTVLSQLEEQRKNDIMITMSMMRDFKMQDVAVSTVLKESLKVVGLALITLALVMSSIPFAKPIGVIAAIVAYMTIRYERTDNTAMHEKGKGRWLSRIISQDEV